MFFVGAFEYVEAQRVAADHQTIFFHENDIRFETRTVRGVHLVSADARAFFIETKNFIPHRHPDVARFAVHAYGIQDALENGRAAFLLLSTDFTAHSLGLRRSLQRRVLYVLAGVAKAVVFADGGLRRIGEPVEKMAFRIRSKLADVQKTIEIGAIGQWFRVAELPDVPSIFVKDHDQVRLA